MNWSLLLSHYPKAILNDETALIIVSLLESYGLLTEQDIIDRAHTPKSRIATALYKLQLDRFIEYGGQHIRLTDLGRLLVDSMDLIDPILEFTVDRVEHDKYRQTSLKDILKVYRKESPDLFQNSVSTLRVWNELVLMIAHFHDLEVSNEELRATAKSLLIRDLRHWYIHRPRSSSFLENINPEIRVLVFNPSVKAVDCITDKWDTCHSLSVRYLSCLDDSVVSESSNNDCDKDENVLYQLVRHFHYHQCKHEPFVWYDSWKSIEKNIPSAKRFKKGVNFLQRLIELIGSSTASAVMSLSAPEAMRLFKRHWDVSDYEASPSDEILWLLMKADNIDEFCELANINKEVAVTLINRIQNKCKSLVEVDSKASESSRSC